MENIAIVTVKTERKASYQRKRVSKTQSTVIEVYPVEQSKMALFLTPLAAFFTSCLQQESEVNEQSKLYHNLEGGATHE